MKIKINYKKICMLILIMLVFCVALSNVDAAITSDNGEPTVEATIEDIVTSGATKVMEFIGEAGLSGFLATTTTTITLLAVLLFVILNVVLVGSTESFALAFPDTIVFNRYPFFDANFINPHPASLIYKMGDVFKNLFASFQAIAIATFVIAAMVMGIKLALSSIAAKKAQYKEYALKWITGFLILICLKWIIAAIFLINETIVAKLWGIANGSELNIPIYITESFSGWFGKPIDLLVKGVSSITGLNAAFHLPGYIGIAVSNICKAMGGNIIASIIAFIIMGQTLTIVGSYLKRVFMCILLGVLGPLVVAVDTINSVLGKPSKVFGSWLKNFAITVFMQSIHALYMVALFSMISSLYTVKKIDGGTTIESVVMEGMTTIQVDIITIALTTGLVKLEKVFKSIFGLGDSFAGNLSDGAKGMVKAMGAVRGLKAGLDAVSDNAKKAKNSSKRVKAYDAEINKLKGRMAGSSDGSTQSTTNTSTTNITNNGGNSGAKNGENKSGNKSTGNYLDDVYNNYASNLSDAEKLEMLEKAKREERSKEFSATVATLLGPANLVAGIGLGMGMEDDIGESLFKGGYMTKGLDFITEQAGYGYAKSRLGKSSGSEGGTNGVTGTTSTSSPGTTTRTTEKTTEKIIEKESPSNLKYQLNPIVGITELNKQFRNLGNEFGDVLKKKIKEADKHDELP